MRYWIHKTTDPSWYIISLSSSFIQLYIWWRFAKQYKSLERELSIIRWNSVSINLSYFDLVRRLVILNRSTKIVFSGWNHLTLANVSLVSWISCKTNLSLQTQVYLSITRFLTSDISNWFPLNFSHSIYYQFDQSSEYFCGGRKFCRRKMLRTTYRMSFILRKYTNYWALQSENSFSV